MECVVHVDRIVELVTALFLLPIRTEILEADDNHLCGMRRQITWHICVDVSEELAPIIGQMMGAADSSKKKSVKYTRPRGVTTRNSAATHRAAFPTLTTLLQSRLCSVHNINVANHKQMDKTCQQQRLTDVRVSDYLVM